VGTTDARTDVTIAVIDVRIVVMTGAIVAMTATIGAADPGCCGDSSMGAPTLKPMALLPLSGATRADRSVTR
jgi:hypothetical protein